MGDDNTDLKMAINNTVWMNAPDTMTLRDAELVALDVFVMISQGVDALEMLKGRDSAKLDMELLRT